ncbi:cellulase family glycosylhydrolase [Actinosynnema mirum]|uniref:Endoglucanase n=1 Tax=Actinosynnema mirum (strain ATCC 29888 / DSM 43827 / JCM 3225 / NBRC 14064 / NCIMB 13271 / NRRL B-12336 / IMRU 3971 / 101) TaxID=446462 RepID=C6WE35_ACTMD|nr:cellulase family glycosylhydrolase [Actinosynnema mirum]ACU35778.1 glycoside hydrolase family 5 [Actinosynnema mirum DSM 43827]
MRTRIALAAAAALLLSAFTAPPPAPAEAAAPSAAAAGFTISGGRLLDANGNDFVLRGVNHAHTWYPTRTRQALADVKALGANSVRVVLASGDRWTRNDAADVADVIAQCKANRLICVLEVHDTTGYGEQSGAIPLSKAVDYWVGVKSALVGQEKYAILNIGNEPYGNTGYAAWTADTRSALTRLRAEGFTHTIMVDAPNWGQDWAFTMRDNAASVFAADPQRNTIFSIHMYGVFDTAAEVDDYLGRFVAAGLPIAVGEFGDMHSDGDPNEDAIFAAAQRLRLGYLAWSWSGNGGGVEYLDLAVDFNAAQLSAWGQRTFNGANGIKATSREASVFGGGDDTRAPTAPGTPTASSVTSSGAVLGWSASTDNVGVTGYDVVRVSGSTETALASTATTSATLTGLTAATAHTLAVYARDAAGNRSTRSGTVVVTTLPGSPVGPCAVTYRVTGQWTGGFQGEVKIANTGTAAVKGWVLRWTWPGAQTVSSMWGGTPTQSGANLSVANASYTADIPAGGSVSVGFTGGVTGANAAPTAFTLNGASCATA